MWGMPSGDLSDNPVCKEVINSLVILGQDLEGSTD